jgi:hypothetical protein
MPTYVFRYFDEDGNPQNVERQFRMAERPDFIYVQDGDAVYRAEHVIVGHARTPSKWQVLGTDSDLPPEGTGA